MRIVGTTFYNGYDGSQETATTIGSTTLFNRNKVGCGVLGKWVKPF